MSPMLKLIILFTFLFSTPSFATKASEALDRNQINQLRALNEKIKEKIKLIKKEQKYQRTYGSKKTRKTKLKFTSVGHKPQFDIPVIYNDKVKKWVKYFQGRGKNWFQSRLGRSFKYIPMMEKILARKKLPKEFTYLAMIESGYSAKAKSHAAAVGYWQFIKPTANRYGLRTNWWIDERQDFEKSTLAATAYLSDLHKMFGSWYLAASAYNMGETRLRRLIKKYRTRNFWVLSQFKDFPKETREYIPKLIATMLIAKNPKLYGFHNVVPKKPYSFSTIYIPGGTDLIKMSSRFNLSSSHLLKLNPELKRAYVPKSILKHKIRVPKKNFAKIKNYFETL